MACDRGPMLITNFLKTATHNRDPRAKMNDVLASACCNIFTELAREFAETKLLIIQQQNPVNLTARPVSDCALIMTY